MNESLAGEPGATIGWIIAAGVSFALFGGVSEWAFSRNREAPPGVIAQPCKVALASFAIGCAAFSVYSLLRLLKPDIGGWPLKTVTFLVATGIVADFWSSYLHLQLNRRRGPSSLSVASFLILYAIPLISLSLYDGSAVMTNSTFLDLLILTCFHGVIVYSIPIWDRRRITRRAKTPE